MKKNQQKVIKERKIFYKIFGRFQTLNIPFRTLVFLWIRQNDADPTGVANPS